MNNVIFLAQIIVLTLTIVFLAVNVLENNFSDNDS